ncbi:HEAT repeat domain-containing protein [Halobacterium salinarum]|uniref:HEAT repeat domain-containing protein n=1 Tax=Halobacterium salinarum TaxID=2242 RepID=UPI0025574687|nr:HEAT repeat domain-containing protein [Halobacterium salinarum]MDL0145247.1 HEAT repeat domain-containing protein [Halobacterium salinarum]
MEESTGNTVIWGHPIALFGYSFGREIRRNIARENPQSGFINRLIEPFHGLIGFLAVFLTGSLFYGIALDLGVQNELMPFAVFGFAITPILHSHYLARQDLSKVKQLRGATEQELPQTTETAYQLLDHRQYQVRIAAIRVLRKNFEQSPGKAVKYISDSPTRIRVTLLDQLDTTDVEVEEQALVCLKWFSRDFGELLVEHGSQIAEYLESNNSRFQAHSAITIGNIGRQDPERTTAYTKVLTDAVKDQDAEVRHASAVALKNLPCKRAAKMLKHLTGDSDPNVRQQANQSLQRVLSAISS